jgi:hypothetical protein
MNAEVSLFGVYVPGLLLLAVMALLLAYICSRLLASISAYRVFAYRPLVDLALFVILLGALALFTAAPDTLS